MWVRTSGLVLSRDVEDAVGVNVEHNVDLGHATRGRGDTGQLKLAEQVVVAGARALALKHLDEDAWLVVGVGGEDLLLLCGNGGVPWDEHGLHNSTAVLSVMPPSYQAQATPSLIR